MLLIPLVLSLPSVSFVAAPGGDETTRPHRSFRFEYSATVPEVPEGTGRVRMWIPVPLDTPDQVITGIELSGSAAGADAVVLEKAKTPTGLSSGSQGALRWTVADVRGGFGRSLCLETSGQAIDVRLAFDVLRYESHGGGSATPDELNDLRQPNAMIPLGGKVSAMAASMKLPADPVAAARALYDHTLERMKYDKPDDGGGWGRGDAEWACDARYGNCTDFHSYFMGLARTQGMAARFEMGFPVSSGGEKVDKVGGYHCWAYVWIDGHGWWPVDISEADKHPEKSDYFFGTLDADRVTMTGGRDLQLEPAPAQGAVNFFVYPYVEIDGEPSKAFTKSFQRTNL